MAVRRAGLTLGQPKARAKFTESTRFPQVFVLVIHRCPNVEITMEWRAKSGRGVNLPTHAVRGLGDGPKTRADELKTKYLEQDDNFIAGENVRETRSEGHGLPRRCESPP